MKAITIKRPYAGLIVRGLKQYETRTWDTSYRGLLAIHAGKQADYAAMQIPAIQHVLGYSWADLASGSILGIVELVSTHCIDADLLQRVGNFEKRCGYWLPGGYAWKLRVVEVFAQPISAVGKLGLWNWEDMRAKDKKQ